MADSQLACMDDGHVNQKIPESRPEFYYSEEQRAAVEALLRDGDGAFKTRLAQDQARDFLSAREIKVIRKSLVEFRTPEEGEDREDRGGRGDREDRGDRDARRAGSSSMRSTYWPQLSDTEVPPLDIGWPHGGFFRGVTRVAVHTHPPKDNGPHLKEVVRRLIQEAGKVIAIVMDLLTDLHILEDLLEAASKRKVSVYIILDIQGVPHFLDMCSRLQVRSEHLQNIRTRTVRVTGFNLSFGRILGSLCSKYMLVDGDKVMFGTYSFSWLSGRMDRNMITVMSGQIVDFFDTDFRELYAVSDKLDLFKEFHISKPSTGTLGRVTVPKRPTLPATSRFQVSLGDAGTLKVPEHKYYNPKYLLAFGDIPGPSGSLPDLSGKTQAEESPEELALERAPTKGGSEKLGTLTPGASLPEKETNKKFGFFSKKQQTSKKSKGKKKDEVAAAEAEDRKPTLPGVFEDLTNSPEEPPAEKPLSTKSKNKKKKNSLQSSKSQEDKDSKGRKRSTKCAVS